MAESLFKFITMDTIINHPIRKALCLSVIEYCILDSIYLLSNNNKYGGWCVASKRYIGESLDVSERKVFQTIDVLLEKELIEKNERGSLKTRDLFNELKANKKDWLIAFKGKESQFLSGQVLQEAKNLLNPAKNAGTMQNVQGGMQEMQSDPAENADYTNIYTNNKYTATTEKICKHLEITTKGVKTLIQSLVEKNKDKDLEDVALKMAMKCRGKPDDQKYFMFAKWAANEFDKAVQPSAPSKGIIF